MSTFEFRETVGGEAAKLAKVEESLPKNCKRPSDYDTSIPVNFSLRRKRAKAYSSNYDDKLTILRGIYNEAQRDFTDAHRDRDTRVISFLLYLNTISKKDGGQFEVYKTKQFAKNPKTFSRFPNKILWNFF